MWKRYIQSSNTWDMYLRGKKKIKKRKSRILSEVGSNPNSTSDSLKRDRLHFPSIKNKYTGSYTALKYLMLLNWNEKDIALKYFIFHNNFSFHTILKRKNYFNVLISRIYFWYKTKSLCFNHFLQEVKELQIFFLMSNKKNRSCHGYGTTLYSSLPPPAKTQVFQITFVFQNKNPDSMCIHNVIAQ